MINRIKHNRILIAILLIILISIGCTTDVDIVDESKDVYIVNAIINADSSVQYITVSKNYFVEGFDPYKNVEDPFIDYAEVTILDSDGDVIIFEKNVIPRPEGSRYDSDLKFYKAENFKPRDGEEYTLNVKVDENTLLTSSFKNLSFNRVYLEVPKEFPIFDQYELNYDWRFFDNPDQVALYKTALMVNYYIETENGLEKRRVEVPEAFSDNSPEATRIYPAVMGYKFKNFGYDNVKRTIFELAPEGPEREKIYLESLELDLTIMNVELGTYFILSRNSNTGFTVLLDYNDYTNIENGLGIFGVTSLRHSKTPIFRSFAIQNGFKHKFVTSGNN